MRLPVVLALLPVAAGSALAQEDSAAGNTPDSAARPRWLVEFKRQSTARGTPEESTKSQVKLDYLPDGAVSLLRLELPFPDADTDFEGSPFNPRLGDVKVRAGFRPVPVAGLPVATFLELTFPTADPESLGTGKYQFSAGARSSWRLDEPGKEAAARRAVSVQVQQVVSFAGDEARKDVNHTKFELDYRCEWPVGHYAKATAKPVIDWAKDGKTGGVLEVEGGWAFRRHWTAALMAGGLLWGKGAAGTYESRVEVKVSHRF